LAALHAGAHQPAGDGPVGWMAWVLEACAALGAISLGAVREFGPRTLYRRLAA